jgi:hypothetical protein
MNIRVPQNVSISQLPNLLLVPEEGSSPTLRTSTEPSAAGQDVNNVEYNDRLPF